eukprot:g29597.t1
MQRHAASCVVLRCAEAVGDTPAGSDEAALSTRRVWLKLKAALLHIRRTTRTTMALYPTGGFVVFIWMPTGGLDDPLHGAEQQPAARKIAGSIGVRGPKWINLRIAEIVHLEAEAVRILLTALQRTLEKKQIAKGIRDLTIRSIWSCWTDYLEERLWYGRKSKTLPDLLEELIFGMAPVMRELRQCQLPKLLCGLGKALKDLLDGRTLHLHPIMQGDVCRFAKTKELALRKKALLLQRVMKWDATHCEPSICKKTIIHKLHGPQVPPKEGLQKRRAMFRSKESGALCLHCEVLFRDCSAAFLEALCKQLQRKIVFPGQMIVEESTDRNVCHRSGRSIRRKGWKTDLETLLEGYPDDKEHMLQVELADITNEEILREVPLLTFLGEGFIKRLAALLQVFVTRKARCDHLSSTESLDESPSKDDQIKSRASVHIGDVTVRELSEGESYGTRLYGQLKSAGHTSPDKRKAVLQSSSLKLLNLSQAQIGELLHLCEERFCIAEQEIA